MATSLPPLALCSSCNGTFVALTRRRAYSLDCPHVFCEVCYENLIRNDTKKCPICNQDFVITPKMSEEFNSKLDGKMEQLDLNVLSEDLKGTIGQSVESSLAACKLAKRDSETSLLSVEVTLQRMKHLNSNINEAMKKLLEIKDETLVKEYDLGTERQRLLNKQRDIQGKVDKLHSIKTTTAKATKYGEATALLTKANGIVDDIRAWSKESESAAQKDESGMLVTEKESHEMNNQMIELVAKIKSIRYYSIHNNPSIQQVMPLKTKMLGQLTVKKLEAMPSKLKTLAKQGMLFAIQHIGAVTRSAKITLRDKKLLLHCLTEDGMPDNAHTIEYDEVLKMVHPESRLAFMELKSSSRTFGTLYIRLNGDTKGAQQFAILCTGNTGPKGPSYAKTPLLAVSNRDMAGENVRFGDYQKTPSGSGGKALLLGLLPGVEYRYPELAGVVSGYGWDKKMALAQFSICTRPSPGQVSNTAFGNVVEGLDEVLCSAVLSHPRIKSVTLWDCGLVINTFP